MQCVSSESYIERDYLLTYLFKESFIIYSHGSLVGTSVVVKDFIEGRSSTIISKKFYSQRNHFTCGLVTQSVSVN